MREPAPPAHDVTRILQEWRAGDATALGRLMPLVYRELHAIARRYLSRERSDHTLQSTALVHEAYLRLVDQRQVDWRCRAHFFGLSARLMRRILVDHARRAARAKRGSGRAKVSLEEAGSVASARMADPVEVLTLDRALRELEAIDARQARVVELRFYGGLTLEETAEALELSPATVKREWAMARAWLYRQVASIEDESGESR
ncbi:MAG TPA: sigma-70 family RNA polymerase sigma factor [Vicinamibacteria bacterium]|nr:sigma-70 family RNA polymerase sigma factor [Vicinamibacteria bacterium]